MAFNYSPKIVTDGLVLYLDAANTRSYPGSGTTWTDLSRSSTTGVLTNGPTFNSANGGSIVFDGADDYIDNITQSISIQDNTPFSIDVIFKTTSTGTAQLIGNWNTLVTPGWRLSIASGQISFFLISANGRAGRAVLSTTATYNNGILYHLCGTYSGNGNVNGISLYVNSISVTTSTVLNTSPGTLTNSKITLGASQLSTTNVANYLNGNIYQTKLYNRALSAQEILQNYNATKTRFGL
jgi:hypothetical protein